MTVVTLGKTFGQTGGTVAPAKAATVDRPRVPTKPAVGRVVIYERDNPAWAAYAILGETPPTPSSTGGGQDWQEVALPFRSSALVWRGQSLLTMRLPIVVQSKWAETPAGIAYVEHQLTALSYMWRGHYESQPPPVVRILINGWQHYPTLDWVLTDPGWGDAVSDPGMYPWQQKLNLTFLQHTDDPRLQRLSPQKGHPLKKRSYIVKQGETLNTIAKKLRIVGGWRALGQAQKPKITDPRRVKRGQHLTLAGLRTE